MTSLYSTVGICKDSRVSLRFSLSSSLQTSEIPADERTSGQGRGVGERTGRCCDEMLMWARHNLMRTSLSAVMRLLDSVPQHRWRFCSAARSQGRVRTPHYATAPEAKNTHSLGLASRCLRLSGSCRRLQTGCVALEEEEGRRWQMFVQSRTIKRRRSSLAGTRATAV